MNLTDFDYPTRNQIIAQHPSPVRDESRLMRVGRATGEIRHYRFRDLPSMLDQGSLIVLNDSKVIPARIRGMKENGGRAEILLLHARGPYDWVALYRGKFRKNLQLKFNGGLNGTLREAYGDGSVLVEFDPESRPVLEHIQEYGEVPLPPYIKRQSDHLRQEDRESYQTVYASAPGSVAAPTAGLHFTRGLIERLKGVGMEMVMITLHVGPGTFKGVVSGDIREHRMDPEYYSVSDQTAAAITRAKRERRKVIAVGTTAARVLESVSDPDGTVNPGKGFTSLFIFPGYSFKILDGLITNFHLPRTTLLMLVSAFAGREKILHAYEAAISEEYRFYSYGDAMAIL